MIIDASTAGSASEVARSATKGAAIGDPGAAPPEIFWSLSTQTTRRSNLALAGRRFNHIFTDSNNKFSRLTVYEHITLTREFE